MKEPIRYNEEDMRKAFNAGYQRGYDSASGEYDEISLSFNELIELIKKKRK